MPPGAWSTPRPGPCTPPSPGTGARRWPVTPPPAPATDIKVRFADPHSPRRRPTNENTGGPVREYFPKGTDFNSVTDARARAARGRLNRRPREVLNGQTPTEILDTIINGATTP